MKILLFACCTRLGKEITEMCYSDVLMSKPVLQTCKEKLISSVEFDIGQNKRYEIYPRYEFHIISKHNLLTQIRSKPLPGPYHHPQARGKLLIACSSRGL